VYNMLQFDGRKMDIISSIFTKEGSLIFKDQLINQSYIYITFTEWDAAMKGALHQEKK